MSAGVVLVVGIVIGLIVAAIVGISMMRSKMVVPERSNASFEETCARVERDCRLARSPAPEHPEHLVSGNPELPVHGQEKSSNL